ncbi:DUF4296 domain-containing protein [Poritiphilus flavus]|uniref:DUF4296 domain-containing protein n=1 Tax=Poritiphilus flavus TaxID=2697053 RepID=A0A6L9EDA1_9FLAO|nr:DUF4296 domain-containing protein [Poritiphilus flavus]NAS12710.1 DUF4296 domain-containing protein [Poritiphilus flavus]
MKSVCKVLLVLLLFACGEKVVEPPENLIPKEKMIAIIYDLAIINAGKSIDVNILDKNGVDPMQYVYDKYEIDSLQLAESNVYYISLPQEYESIYLDVEARLEKEREKMQAKKDKTRDSIKEANEDARIQTKKNTN